jgi:hypothetical protein
VYIPEHFSIDTSGYVLDIGWTITNKQGKLTDVVKAHEDADTAEAKARHDADSKIN